MNPTADATCVDASRCICCGSPEPDGPIDSDRNAWCAACADAAVSG